MTVRLAVMFESDADHRIASDLINRLLVERIDWLEDELLDHTRKWITATRNSEPLAWKSIPRMAHQHRIRKHGHFDGRPGEPDAASARRAILVLRKEFDELDAIILIRDQDNRPQRRQGLEQARQEASSPPEIVIGMPIPERECWVLSGFEPRDEDESRRLNSVRQDLGFDPTTRSHRLTAGSNDSAKTSPKRVMATLMPEPARQADCWQLTALGDLHNRGRDNGLADFLDEAHRRLVPLVDGRS